MVIPCFALLWKRKRGNRSKSIIMPNLAAPELAFLSTTSLPVTSDFHTTTVTELLLRNKSMSTNESSTSSSSSQPSPPCYCDDMITYASSHPAFTNITSHHGKRQYIIEQREEEGKEDLPPYECTVYKMGYMMIKTELDGPNKRSKRRSWRRFYMVLWGTTIRAYKHIPMNEAEEKKPLWCYSMQDAEAGQASDYRKRRNVIRLRIHHGPQFLIRTKNDQEQLVWIEHLQASANVSLDLDNRKMPQFITSSRRRRRARLTHDLSTGHHHQREGALI